MRASIPSGREQKRKIYRQAGRAAHCEQVEMPVNRQVIYIVDDERLIAETLATILVRAGFIAIAFADPCLAMASARATPPDILISDVMMPVMTGVELGIETRAISPECRVLLFSGKTHPEELLETLQDRGLDFEVLSKPMHPSELLAKLRAAPLTKSHLAFQDERLTAVGPPAVSKA
jgi:DNA-binding response OmpR family regulator